MRNPLFVGRHNLKIFIVPATDCHRYCVSVLAFWRNWGPPRILSVLSPSVSAHYHGAFDDNNQRLGYLLLETKITEFTSLFLVWFSQAAEVGAADLFLRTRLRTMTENGRPRANERVLARLSWDVSANFLMCGLLGIISQGALDPAAVLLAFNPIAKID